MNLYKKTKTVAKHYFRKCGFSLTRLTPASDATIQLITAIDHFSINLIFDIGANEGQFASELFAAGFKGRIVSFEPLEEAHTKLKSNAKRVSNWLVHERTAIGETNGEIQFNVSENSVSSSALPILDSHTSAESRSKYVDKVRVPLTRLDSVFHLYSKPGDRTLIKIDTQGFESKVLDGAETSIELSQCILCELSLVPLYEGQHLWQDLVARICELGYTVWAIQRGFTDRATGRTMQVNGLFARST